MYKVGLKQQRFDEKKLTVDSVKESLPDAIDEENKRINVDSSKKRACLQHMDYDNFHQMVLGANLIPVKAGSLENINDNKLRSSDLNTHAALSTIMSKNYKDREDLLTKYADLYKQEEELKRVPKSQNEFEKYFMSKLKTNEERFKYILNVPISQVATIFKADVNSDLLVHILNVFHAVITDRLQMKEEQKSKGDDVDADKENMADNQAADNALFSYMGDFMNLIAKSTGFDFVVCFFSDKDKQSVKDICNGLEQFEYPNIDQIKKSYEIE